ncbi:MAG: hypothetical protein U9Q98_09080 [Bacteroidota bacterium]|nr:hypothetical protein [Bacteroidota bacterium]
MNKKDEFIALNIGCLEYKSKQDLIENLYLKAISDTYNRIDKHIGIENDIRDRFISDFYHVSPFLKELIQTNILYVNWERWVFKNEKDLGRTDLSFAISGFEFIIECKRLKNVSQKYIDEGLTRFINGDYSSEESYAGMIGFITEGDPGYTYEQMKEKCKTESYINSSFITEPLIGFKYYFKTTHERKKMPIVNIYHLFLEFNKIKN